MPVVAAGAVMTCATKGNEALRNVSNIPVTTL